MAFGFNICFDDKHDIYENIHNAEDNPAATTTIPSMNNHSKDHMIYNYSIKMLIDGTMARDIVILILNHLEKMSSNAKSISMTYHVTKPQSQPQNQLNIVKKSKQKSLDLI